MSLKMICVFCGARPGCDSVYGDAADALGRRIVEEGCGLVYGGGEIGLMGMVADAVSGAGGHVSAIIPRFLDEHEVGRRHSDEFIVTESMHERKFKMAELADAFVCLPGGLGTLDETFEILTWKQLGLHDKPIVVVNIAGYWSPLAAMVDSVIENGFAKAADRDLFSVVDGVDDVFPELRRMLVR
ncbi:MAG: TIGR00730 family Rossman fold protein [Rhodospirillales bacterium]